MKTWTAGIGKSRRKYHLLLDASIDGSIDCPQRTHQLYVDPKLKGTRAHLETLIHEGYHGECPTVDEETVTRVGYRLARLLWGVGYRLVEDK